MEKTTKRKSLCIYEKVLLIRAIETGEKISDVGKRFGFSPSTVSTIWKNKDKILQAKGEGKSSKRLKKPKYEDLDKAILSWFHRQRQNNMPISGPLLKSKAKDFSKELGLTCFKASEGWLGKFKQRHNINCRKIETSIDEEDTELSNGSDEKLYHEVLLHNIKRENSVSKDPLYPTLNSALPSTSETINNIQEERDDTIVFGEYITKKLRNMDAKLKVIVQYEINKIMYKAEMGFLTI